MLGFLTFFVHVDTYILLSSTAFLCYDKAHAYVGELLGMLGSLLTLHFLLSKLNYTEYPTIHIHSDCMGALNWLLFTRHRIKNKTDYCRIIRGIASELSIIPIQISGMYVNAHLDNDKSWEDLSHIESELLLRFTSKMFSTYHHCYSVVSLPTPFTKLEYIKSRFCYLQ